jgi:hypothetical protein
MFFSLEPHLPGEPCKRAGRYQCVSCDTTITMQRGGRFPPPDHHCHGGLGYAEIRWTRVAASPVPRDEPAAADRPHAAKGDSARMLREMMDEFYQRLPRPRSAVRLQRPGRSLF